MSEAEERPDRDQSPDARMVELDRLNQELLESGRLKSAFLANLSHELRSPLTAILGFSEVLRDQIAGPLNTRQADQIDQIRAGRNPGNARQRDQLHDKNRAARRTTARVTPGARP